MGSELPIANICLPVRPIFLHLRVHYDFVPLNINSVIFQDICCVLSPE